MKMTFAILNRFCLACFLSIHLFFSAEGNIHVFQKPRFVGLRTGRTVRIYCVPSNPSLPAHVEWFKGQAKKLQLNNSKRINIKEKSDKINASIIISKLETEDSGTYFCRLNNTFGPGTELQVFSRCQFVDAFCFLCLYFSLCLFSRIRWPPDYLEQIESQGCFHFPSGFTVDFVHRRSSGSVLQNGKGHNISTDWSVHFFM